MLITHHVLTRCCVLCHLSHDPCLIICSAVLQASPPQGFPFFGMPPSLLSALSQSELQTVRASSMSDATRNSVQLSVNNLAEMQGTASGTYARTSCQIALHYSSYAVVEPALPWCEMLQTLSCRLWLACQGSTQSLAITS